jgi:hypothetical protein
MTRLVAVAVAVLVASAPVSAQRTRQWGRAIVEYSSPQVKAVAAYEYSQRNHDGRWLLVELAVQARARIAIERSQISLLTPDKRRVGLATQAQFLADHQAMNQMLQNAKIWRRPLDAYFPIRPQPTIRFFAFPGALVHDSFVSNPDEVATGDLFFVSPGPPWTEGSHTLVISHPEAGAELPLELR